MSGPAVAAGVERGYPGARLGRPASGPGAVAGVGRRVAGVLLDWGLATLVAVAFLGGADGPLGPFATLAVFGVQHWLLVGTLGHTIGHRLMGLHVERLDGAAPGPARALGRTALLCLAVPALVWDLDSRGMHDKLVGTLVARR
jgi:uncharacterized RDD family membrane protein YckC